MLHKTVFFILKEAKRFADFSVLEIAFQLVPSPSAVWSFEYLLQLMKNNQKWVLFPSPLLPNITI